GHPIGSCDRCRPMPRRPARTEYAPVRLAENDLLTRRFSPPFPDCRTVMKNFTFPHQFRTLYEKAVALHAAGTRGPETFFTPEEKRFLAANGITPQHVYDYAEDHNGYEGEPGLLQALGI